MNSVNPSTLQSFNNELVKGLGNLRETHEILSSQIDQQEVQRQDLEQKIQQLSQQLQELDNDLKQKYKRKAQVEGLISDTEAAYVKIVESSQTLLDILQKQTSTLTKQR